MRSKLAILALLVLAIRTQEDVEMDDELPHDMDMDGEMPEPTDYSQIDTSEYVKNVDIYFEGREGDIQTGEAIDLLLLTYGEVSLEDVEQLQKKFTDNEEMEDADEEKLFLKMHIEYFFDEQYNDVQLTTDIMRQILRDSELLVFLERKMREEENHEGFEIDDEDLEQEVDTQGTEIADDEFEGEELDLDLNHDDDELEAAE